MAKKTQDLKPDVILKNYWSGNEQFADLFNAVLFDGEQVIRADELEDIDTEESSVFEHREYAESIKASRDNIKVNKRSTTLGVELVLLGKEAQEHIHYAMPLRVMGYDYTTYKKQYDSNAKKYKTEKGLSEDEYLSKMRKTDKIVSVITVVVYYGETAWDGATTLHEMLDIPPRMKKFVNDYKMILVEAASCTSGENRLKFHNIDNKDLFNLLEILLNSSISKAKARKKAVNYAMEHKVDKSVIMTVAGAANCRIDYNALDRKGEIKMWSVFEEVAKENEIKGEAKCIVQMGFEFGLSEKDILNRLQNKLNVSLQKAQEYLEMYGKQPV